MDTYQKCVNEEVAKALSGKDTIPPPCPKDPEAPKKPTSAYLHFCKVRRQQLKKDNPEVPNKEITSMLGSEWKAMEDKSEWDSRHEVSKKEYQEAMKNYTPSKEWAEANPEAAKKVMAAKQKLETDKNKEPAKAKTAYQFFSKEMRDTVKEENPEMDSKEVNKEVSRMWKEDYKGAAERKKWTLMATKDKRRHLKELKAWADKQVITSTAE